MSRGPDASQLWMMGGLPTFREFKINTGIEALKEVWDRLPELKTKGRDGIHKILADHWKGKFSEDNSAIIANGIWSCILLHGDKSEQSLPGTDQRDRPAAPAAKAKTGKQPQGPTEARQKKVGRKPNQTIADRNKETAKVAPQARGWRRSPKPSEARARTVAKLIKELDILEPQMYGESDYERLAKENPCFLTFRIADRRGDLKEKVLYIQGHQRHIRLAQELAAAVHGMKQNTIRTDWKHHKPPEFRRNLS